ncbi:hypothetical protein BH23ACT12_BH23ACT12_22260 [soil metagenome]
MSQNREKIWGLSKAEADYGPPPTAGYECRNCKYMFPKLSVGTCKLVRGSIRADYSCKEFKPDGR